jgi:restriction endonuclease S subunit
VIKLATAKVINLSDLGGARRINPEFYQPDYVSARDRVLLLPTKTIEQMSTSVLSFGAYSLCNYIIWRESGIPYLKAENILDGYIDFSEAMFIDEDVHNILAKSEVSEGQVLFSMSGTTGNAAVAYKIPPKLNASQDVAKITLKHGYSPFYVAAFLNSKYGRLQTQREIVGSVQQHVFLWQIKNFIVPIVSKESEAKIEVTQREGLDQLSRSHTLFFQAENLLLDELGLKDFKPKYGRSYTANIAEAFEARRIDAEYFQPAYEQVTGKVLDYQNGYTPLLGCVEAVQADFDSTRYPDSSFRYVELADIDASIGVIHSAGEVKGDEAPSRARRVLKRGDIICSSVEGSLEKVALVDGEQEGSLASTGFFQFRARTIYPEVLLVLSKGIVLQAQLKRECTGTILTAVPNQSLKRILVPVLPPEFQQKITSLVQQSHEARRKARELLEQAKSQVEQMIETTCLN